MWHFLKWKIDIFTWWGCQIESYSYLITCGKKYSVFLHFRCSIPNHLNVDFSVVFKFIFLCLILFLLPMCVCLIMFLHLHVLSTSLGLSQIEEEFRRVTLKPLQSTFLGKLDQYTSKLLSLYRRNGGAVGKKLDETLDVLNEACIYNSVVVVSFM